MPVIYLALGSNLGDRLANLRAALHALAPQIRVTKESKVYETPPWGYEDQPAFLNMAISAETSLEPVALLAHLKNLEADLGRVRTFQYGPRQIDLDILFYDNLTLEAPLLRIPHPHLHERAFVLVPLNDIASDFVHPVLHKTIQELLAQISAEGITEWINPRRASIR
jgi:2-amino-4-hydroxy-6-hydroxymethyldihydropteridine diphosphokinase